MKYTETYFVTEYEPNREAIVELKNGRIVDVINGRFFDPGVRILIQGTKIVAMPNLESEPRPDYSIDLQGKTAIPGLFNTHCHVNQTAALMAFSFRGMLLQRRYGGQQIARNLTECLCRGITNIRDAFSADLAGTQALSTRKPGPRILQSVAVALTGSYFAPHANIASRMLGNVFGGGADHESSQSGVVEIPVDASKSQVRGAVDRAIDERGADAIKIGEQRYDTFTLKPTLTIMTMEQLQALTDQARKRGIPTQMHHMSVESFRRGVEAGVSSLSHYPFDGDLTPEDGKAFMESGCIIEPTISTVYELTWKIKGDPWQGHPDKERLLTYRANEKPFASIAEEFYIPELQEAVSSIEERFSREDFKVLGLINMAELFRATMAIVPHGVGNIKKLRQWGAPIALANDGGSMVSTPPMMGFELALLDLFLNQEPGKTVFSGADALRIATINSARSMSLGDRFGTLEVGKTADIAIVDGNPFEDYRVIGSRVAALFMDGRLVINNCSLKVGRES